MQFGKVVDTGRNMSGSCHNSHYLSLTTNGNKIDSFPHLMWGRALQTADNSRPIAWLLVLFRHYRSSTERPWLRLVLYRKSSCISPETKTHLEIGLQVRFKSYFRNSYPG